mmetsp:Transcript_28372/g.70896  ORF Transcript_28372/g.70896 Transcript_28372/m.70896 type:complete len:97 (+) Transcript_28372:679-969(+)
MQLCSYLLTLEDENIPQRALSNGWKWARYSYSLERLEQTQDMKQVYEPGDEILPLYRFVQDGESLKIQNVSDMQRVLAELEDSTLLAFSHDESSSG